MEDNLWKRYNEVSVNCEVGYVYVKFLEIFLWTN